MMIKSRVSIMKELVAMFITRLSLCLLLLLSFWHSAHGARMRSDGVHALPPCKDALGGIPNWDCYDPPAKPLPPCDFKHQNPGIDCSADLRSSAAADVTVVSHSVAVSTGAVPTSHAQINEVDEGLLPPRCNFLGCHHYPHEKRPPLHDVRDAGCQSVTAYDPANSRLLYLVGIRNRPTVITIN